MTERQHKPLYEPTSIAAAKIFAEHVGTRGRTGGWIYTADGRPICQGWQAYADRLTYLKILVPKRTSDGNGGFAIRWAINWRATEWSHENRARGI